MEGISLKPLILACVAGLVGFLPGCASTGSGEVHISELRNSPAGIYYLKPVTDIILEPNAVQREILFHDVYFAPIPYKKYDILQQEYGSALSGVGALGFSDSMLAAIRGDMARLSWPGDARFNVLSETGDAPAGTDRAPVKIMLVPHVWLANDGSMLFVKLEAAFYKKNAQGMDEMVGHHLFSESIGPPDGAAADAEKEMGTDQWNKTKLYERRLKEWFMDDGKNMRSSFSQCLGKLEADVIAYLGR